MTSRFGEIGEEKQHRRQGCPIATLRVTGKNEVLGELVGVKRMETLEKPTGEWNLYEITVDGPRLTAFINGTKVNEAWDCEVLGGLIGLQSEGGEIHFRRIALTSIEKGT